MDSYVIMFKMIISWKLFAFLVIQFMQKKPLNNLHLEYLNFHSFHSKVHKIWTIFFIKKIIPVTIPKVCDKLNELTCNLSWSEFTSSQQKKQCFCRFLVFCWKWNQRSNTSHLCPKRAPTICLYLTHFLVNNAGEGSDGGGSSRIWGLGVSRSGAREWHWWEGRECWRRTAGRVRDWSGEGNLMSSACRQRCAGKHVRKGIFPRISQLPDTLHGSEAELPVMCFMSQALLMWYNRRKEFYSRGVWENKFQCQGPIWVSKRGPQTPECLKNSSLYLVGFYLPFRHKYSPINI